MRHPHWSSDHRDALLTRVTAITVGVAAASTAGAVALGAGLQAGTTYAAATKTPKAAEPSGDASAPIEQGAPAGEPTTQPSADAGSSAPVVALPPDQVHVVIYNATTTRGVAAAAARILRQEGFHVDSVASNPDGALRTSSIVYSADAAGGVQALEKATGVQQTVSGDTGNVVLLVLGRDWVSATAGTAWAPPQAVPQQQGGPSRGSTSGGGSSSGGGGGTTTSGGS